MTDSLVRWSGAEPPELRCAQHLSVDLVSGAVRARVDDVLRIGAPGLRVSRMYDSRARAASPLSLGCGWALVLRGFRRAAAPHGVIRHVGPAGAELDLHVRGETLAALEARSGRARVATRWFEIDDGHLVRVRDEREGVLEEYEYDGSVLVAARIGSRPWTYFEYDDRGRGSRCVRTWSETGKRDRRITYAGRATVLDDGSDATSVLQRGEPEVALIDAEMRRVTPTAETERGGDPGGVISAVHLGVGGELAGIDVSGTGRLEIRTDACGRVIELRRRDGDAVVWRYEGDRLLVNAMRSGRVEAALETRAETPERVESLFDSAVGAPMAMQYDPDGGLVSVERAGVRIHVESDGEGRPVAVAAPSWRRAVVRDRAGLAVAIESEGGIRASPGSGTEIADVVVNHLLHWSVETARDLLLDRPPTPPSRAPSLPTCVDETIEAHLGLVLAHARALGWLDSADCAETRPGDQRNA